MKLLGYVLALMAATASGQVGSHLTTGPPGCSYNQGAEPVLDRDGTIHLWADWGCLLCSKQEWRWGETVGVIHYPKYGRPLMVRYLTSDLIDDGHESSYPTLLWWDGRWVVSYASTRRSTIGQQNRVGAGLIITSYGGWETMRDWHRPSTPWFPVSWAQPRCDELYLYGTHYTPLPPNPRGVYRWRVTPGTWEIGPYDPVVFGDNEWVDPSQVVYDEEDGMWYALSSRNFNSVGTYAEEWTSSNGLTFSRTGRRWSLPATKVFDASYLIDRWGKMVHPQVVVANYAPGGQWADEGWALWYWAEDGAVLPEGWGEELP